MRHDTRQSGFSLIEILIGMTIGLIVILVILQTMSLFEGQRRTSSGVVDMQSNGLLSLNALQQDTRLAGYGMIVNFGTGGDLPCVRVNGHGTTPGIFDMIPISIASSGVQDVITIGRMESTMGGLMTGGVVAHIAAAMPTVADLTVATGIVLDSESGVLKVAGIPQTVGVYPAGATDPTQFTYQVSAAIADTVLVAADSGVAKLDCTLLQVSQQLSATSYVPPVINLTASEVSAVTNGISVPSSVVPTNGIITAASPAKTVLRFVLPNNAGLDTTRVPAFASPSGVYPARSVIHNLGPNPALVRTQFFVDGAAQFVRKVNNGADEIVADNVVSLQAQYGISATGQQAINCWVNPTGAGTNPAIANYCPAGEASDWTPAGLQATPGNMKRIKAIRVAIVARNPLMEKPENKALGCVTTRTAPTSWLNGPVIDLTANPDWKCYRYKVYQTIIPLHNVILGNI